MGTPDTLIERAKTGDKEAFQLLIAEHQDRIRRIVMRFLGMSPEVDDVVQEVLIQLFRSLPRFRGDSKFTTWLYRVSLNVTKMHLRRLGSRPRFAELPENETVREGSTEKDSPEEAAIRTRRVAALQKLVAALPDKKRTVLILHDFEGQRPQDISEIVDAPVMTVRTRLFYARKELYAAIATDPDLANMMSVSPRQPAPKTSAKGGGKKVQRVSEPGETA